MRRKFGAILAADVAGYSRLTGLDEEGTYRRLIALRTTVIEPLVTRHSGRVANYAGDSVLAEFADSVAALECGLAIQRLTADSGLGEQAERQLLLRIGLHIGDFILAGSDIYGDHVNVASRLEQLDTSGNRLNFGR